MLVTFLHRNRKKWVFAGTLRHSTHLYLPVHRRSPFQITVGMKLSAPTTVRTVCVCACRHTWMIYLCVYSVCMEMCAVGIERTSHQSPLPLSNAFPHVLSEIRIHSKGEIIVFVCCIATEDYFPYGFICQLFSPINHLVYTM